MFLDNDSKMAFYTTQEEQIVLLYKIVFPPKTYFAADTFAFFAMANLRKRNTYNTDTDGFNPFSGTYSAVEECPVVDEQPMSFLHSCTDSLRGFIDDMRNEVYQHRLPIELREESNIRWLRLLFSKRLARRTFFVLGGGAVFLLLLSAFLITRSASDPHHQQKVQDALISTLQLQSAEQNDYAYKTPAHPVNCHQSHSPDALGMNISVSLLGRSLERILWEEKAPCICAPMTGVLLQYVVVRDQDTFSESSVHLMNPEKISLPMLTSSETRAVLETSELYPDREPRRVKRQNKIRVKYQDAACETQTYMMRKHEAYCMQSCLDMMNGTSIYDVDS